MTNNAPEPDVETKSAKAERLTAAGYRRAVQDVTCGLCRSVLHAGQWRKAMPATWEPANPCRLVHWRCHVALVESLKARAAGQPVPVLPWERAGYRPVRKHDKPAPVRRGPDAEMIKALAARDGERAARWVADRVADHGTGPTWRELSLCMGWPGTLYRAVIPTIARAGLLRYSDETRSLRPGPGTHDRAGRRR